MSGVTTKPFSTPLPSNLARSGVWSLAETVASKVGFPNKPLETVVSELGGSLEYRHVEELESSGAIEIRAKNDFTIFLPLHTGTKRDRFTIGHELGHYFLHFKLPMSRGDTPSLPMKVSRYGSDRTETEANWFAAAFLMPEGRFKDAFASEDGNLIAVAAEFNVSVSAATVRATSLGLLGTYPGAQG